jgi:hypothetical protein
MLWLLLAGLTFSCANVVSPTGGPRDEDPPEVVRSTPPNYSARFSGGEVRIYFDEYVELRNLSQQMLISPPLSALPEVRLRRQSIVFEINETLRPNTTYSLFFGDAIRDITEGNVIPNFQFVFSTGEYVDSLSVAGQVLDAFTLEPVADAFVMLYDSIVDSIPYLERPVYLAKTDKEGQFAIRNMRPGEYLAFGLVDNNANFLYDLPDERIAFLDSLVSPVCRPVPAATPPEGEPEGGSPEGAGPSGEEPAGGPAEPSAGAASSGRPSGGGPQERAPEGDIPGGDPVPPSEEGVPGQEGTGLPFYTLYLFQEADTVQRITASQAVGPGQIRLVFRVPFDSVGLRELKREVDGDWHLMESNPGRDTLTVWLPDPLPDSLFVEVTDRGQVLDTLELATRPRQPRGREETAPVPPDRSDIPLELSLQGLRAGTWPHFRPLEFTASSPLDTIQEDLVVLLMNDSIPLEPAFHFTDPVRRRLRLDKELEEESNYRLEFLPGALTGLFGARNDTLAWRFKTTSAEAYGKLIMNLVLPREGSRYVLQLLGQNLRVVEERQLEESGTVTFPNLAPGTYSLRLIHDRNGNGRWDPGNYLRGILPEKVYMHDEPLQVRQNWELEMPWQPSD